MNHIRIFSALAARTLVASLVLILATTSAMAQNNKICCHIEGDVTDKPLCNMLLVGPADDEVTAGTYDTIRVKDGRFVHEVLAAEECLVSIIPCDEYDAGSWMPATFIAENGNVAVKFVNNSLPVIRTSAPLNSEYLRVKQEANDLYYFPVARQIKVLEQDGKDLTPEAAALAKLIARETDAARRDSLLLTARQMEADGTLYTPEYAQLQKQQGEALTKIYLHYVKYAAGHPSLAGLSLLLSAKEYSQGNAERTRAIARTFRDTYADRYPDNRMTKSLDAWCKSLPAE